MKKHTIKPSITEKYKETFSSEIIAKTEFNYTRECAILTVFHEDIRYYVWFAEYYYSEFIVGFNSQCEYFDYHRDDIKNRLFAMITAFKYFEEILSGKYAGYFEKETNKMKMLKLYESIENEIKDSKRYNVVLFK